MNARPILGLLLMTAAIMIPLYAAAQNDTATLSEKYTVTNLGSLARPRYIWRQLQRCVINQ